MGSKAARWGAGAILFTDKDRTAHLTKSLAHQFEGKLAFGEVRKADKELAERFNISGYVPSNVQVLTKLLIPAVSEAHYSVCPLRHLPR